MAVKLATRCPECGAQDSLVQNIIAEVSGNRPVHIEGPGHATKVAYGPADLETFDPQILDEEGIQCTRCKKEWADQDALFDIGPPIEHRCTACLWWGFNDFQHDLERPACPGVVYRIDKPPAEVCA